MSGVPDEREKEKGSKMMREQFTAQVARLTKGVKYVAGGGGYPFDVGEIAERVLPGLRGGQLFAYLFRRFGYPDVGWDEYKNLASYRITTPLPEIFLEITPHMGGDDPNGKEESYDRSCLMFGYCIAQVIEKEWKTCLKTGGDDAWDEHPQNKAVNQAIESAMRDLLRPVYVRDVPINCYGRVDEEREMLPHVEAYHAAGYPIPQVFFRTTDQWEQFTAALITLGDGSMEKGMEHVIKTATTSHREEC